MGKTQVFGMGGSDFFRTRLTHSLEAAQIGKGIALRCGANTDLVETACLAHDIGHPPFGHAGERKLQELMEDSGGFEGNAQNLRIIHRIESKHPEGGLNLTRATLDAILKYKISYTEASQSGYEKFYYDDDKELVEWATAKSPAEQNSFECQIMKWADDIAYSTHDLEDGIKAGLITTRLAEKQQSKIRDLIEKKYNTWSETKWQEVISIMEKSEKASSEKEMKLTRKETISRTIGEFIKAAKPKRLSGSFSPRYQLTLDIDKSSKLKCHMLKFLVWETVITNERIATLSRKAQLIVEGLFKQFTSDNSRNMFPHDFQEMLEKTNGDEEYKRIACDYIAGMTDTYAMKIYGRLYGHEMVSIFEII